MKINRVFFLLVIYCLYNFKILGQSTIYTNNFEGFLDGFDLSTLNEWLSVGNGGSVLVNETNGLASQESSVRIAMNNNGWGYAAHNFNIISGKNYEIKVWIKPNNNQSAISLRLYDGGVNIDSASISGITGWREVSLIHTAVATTNLQIRILKNWGTMYFDDFSIKCLDCSTLSSSSYYVNSSGNDNNLGTISDPWKTLERVSRQTLNPGDSVLFNRGDRFDGHLSINGSGKDSLPVVIGSYGTGNKPIITAELGVVGGGDFREAIYILNHDNIVIKDIEINNERNYHRFSVDSALAYGIYFHNSGNKPLNNFKIENLSLINIYAFKPMLDPDDFNGLEVSGIRFFSERNTITGQEKNFNNITIENCYFNNIQRLGVHIKHAGSSGGVGNDSINKNSNIVCRNNHFYRTGGTCILPIRTYNCLIEDNLFDRPGDDSDFRMPNRGSAVWTWNCKYTVIQRNECLHIRGYLDSHGIHIDHHNDHTYVQYNYMEDCEGGFVEILGGNTNAVYRFNISVNDGWRDNPNWTNSNHTLWVNDKASGGVIDYCDETYIYNNTVFVDSSYITAIDMDGLNHHIYNNIFYYSNGSVMGGKQMLVNNNNTPLFMKNNLYAGNVVSSFINLDDAPVQQNPIFFNEGDQSPFGYQLMSNSPAIDAGVNELGPAFPKSGLGVFSHVPIYPDVDYFGNEVDFQNGLINIGADNSKNGPITSIINTSKLNKEISFRIFPNPNDGNFQIVLFNNLTQGNIIVKTLDGKIVYNLLSNSEYFNLDLISGVYILSLKTELGYISDKLFIK